MSLPTPAQLERIGAELRDMRACLAAQLRERLHDNGQALAPGLHRYLSDELDTADAAEQFADDLAWLGHEAASLRHIDAALRRLAERRYGVCQDCGAAIPVERLLAMPAAYRCLPCQRLAEQSPRPAGAPDD